VKQSDFFGCEVGGVFKISHQCVSQEKI